MTEMNWNALSPGPWGLGPLLDFCPKGGEGQVRNYERLAFKD